MDTVTKISVPEIKLVYNSTIKPSERPHVDNSRKAYDLLIAGWDMELIELQEQFKIILLNRANRVLGIVTITTGGLTHTIADVRLILAAGIISAASNIVLAHNHPSGNLTPSRPDEALTKKIQQAAAYHDFTISDHLIVTGEGYYSFADEGLL